MDTDNLLVSQPDNGEQALEIAEMLIRSGAMDVIVVDSVAALVPKAEIEGEMGEAQMGLQARLMSQALRKLTAIVSKSRTSLIFINQIREKIGVMFGNPETTTGGRALKFYSSVRIDIRRIAAIKEGDVVLKDFAFRSGESLPELRMHYTTLGAPHRNAAGVIDNAVMVLHGTGGTGQQFLRPQFADELYGPGQPLDIRQRLDKIIAHHTGQPIERVAKDTERDYFMSAEEAKEYGIIDRVIEKH